MTEDFSRLQQQMSTTHVLLLIRAVTKKEQKVYRLLSERDAKIREIVTEIARKVIRDSSDRVSEYALFAGERQLQPVETIRSLADARGNLPEFHFSKKRTSVELINEETHKSILVETLPVILGRYQPGEEPDEYTINLLDYAGKTVSRRHARLSFQDGEYYVEHISDRNTLLLNGDSVERGSSRKLSFGNTIALGTNLRLRFAKR